MKTKTKPSSQRDKNPGGRNQEQQKKGRVHCPPCHALGCLKTPLPAMTGFVKNILSKVAEEESRLEWVEE